MQVDRPRVLIVEDETLIAMMLEEHLLDAGCEIVATASDVKTGLAYAETHDLDAAILDISLGSSPSFPIADVLIRRGIPFLFASGFGSSGLPADYRAQAVLNKPFIYPELIRTLQDVLGQKFALEGKP